MSKEKSDPSFGAFLRNKRLAVKLSQEAAANALGYSELYFLSRIENNRVALPLDKVPRIASLYNIPTTELVEAVVEEHTRVLRARLKTIIEQMPPQDGKNRSV